MLYLYCALGIIAALFILYGFLIAPRWFHRPERAPFLGVHYAHRGLHDNNSDAPENSLAAFRKAVAAGYGIELDVQLTKDNIAVVFHDATLLRMCGVPGSVWDYTLAELQTFSLSGSTETIPTFADVLQAVRGQVPLIIEYKMDRPTEAVCEIGNALLTEYTGAYCVESFHPLALSWYRRHRPEILRGQLSENYMRNKKNRGNYSLLAMKYLLSNVFTRPDFIAYNHIDRRNLSRRLCRKMGALSVAYTIKSTAQYEECKNDFDLFIFDSCRL